MNQKYKQKSRSLSWVLGSSREGIVKNSDTYIAANQIEPKDHNLWLATANRAAL